MVSGNIERHPGASGQSQCVRQAGPVALWSQVDIQNSQKRILEGDGGERERNTRDTKLIH